MPCRSLTACVIAVSALAPVTAAQSVSVRGELPLVWDAVAPGVWKATVGTPDSLSLLDAAGGAPRRDALLRLPSVDFPLPREEIRVSRRDRKVSLRFPLEPSEELYGLGLNFKAVGQRGTVKQLHVDHYGGSDNGRTHAPVPFYVSSPGHGVLIEVDEFVARGYPLDVIGLEPGWQSAAYPGTFVWDTTRFPDAPEFMRQMQRRGVAVNLWINPYVSPRAPFYEKLRPLSGSHTVWTGLVPDFTLAETRAVVLDLFRREHLDLGVSGYKIDEVDGYDRWLWPDDAELP